MSTRDGSSGESIASFEPKIGISDTSRYDTESVLIASVYLHIPKTRERCRERLGSTRRGQHEKANLLGSLFSFLPFPSSSYLSCYLAPTWAHALLFVPWDDAEPIALESLGTKLNLDIHRVERTAHSTTTRCGSVRVKLQRPR